MSDSNFKKSLLRNAIPAADMEDVEILDADDLDLIDAVEAEITARSDSYVYDEEETTVGNLCSTVDGDKGPEIDCNLHSPSEDEDKDEPDDLLGDEDDEFAEDEEERLSSEEDEDLVLVSSGQHSFALLDDSYFSEDGKASSGLHLDETDGGFFGFDDEEDLLSDIEADGRYDLGDIEVSERLTREERARQVAIRVGGMFGWSRSGVELLTAVFEEHGWGQARLAVEQLIEEGISEDELQLIKDLKDLWEGNEEYGMAFLRPNNRTGYCTYQGGRVLSWRMAARLTRLFPTADICEVECFLDNAFDMWYERRLLRHRFPVFLNFLKHAACWLDPQHCLPGAALYDEVSAEDFEYETEKDLRRTLLYRQLVDYGLIPRLHSDFPASIAAKKGMYRERTVK